jgi:hypothetical protein
MVFLTPVSSLISISTVWKRLSTRGQYCTGSKTLVTIPASLPSTCTILNSGTWTSPTILGSTSGHVQEFSPLVVLRRFQTVEIDIRDDTGVKNTIRSRTRGGDTSLQKEKGVVSRMKQPHHCQAKAYHDYYLHQAGNSGTWFKQYLLSKT